MQPPQVVFFQLPLQSLPLQQENRRHTALLQRTSSEMLIWGIYSTSWIQKLLLSIFKSFETSFRLYKSKCQTYLVFIICRYYNLGANTFIAVGSLVITVLNCMNKFTSIYLTSRIIAILQHHKVTLKVLTFWLGAG